MKPLSLLLFISSVLLYSSCEDEAIIANNKKAESISDTGARLESPSAEAKTQNKFYFQTTLVSRFEFDLRVLQDGPVTVDWGDGTRERLSLLYDNQNFITHVYPAAGEYRISFNGNVKNIHTFIANPPVKDINTKVLRNLENLLVTYSYVPVYDLRSNTKLRQLAIRALYDHTHFYMPASHDILYADLSNSSIENIDEVISSIHTNAVIKNITDGTIHIRNLRQHFPSEESLSKLADLANSYYWQIFTEWPTSLSKAATAGTP